MNNITMKDDLICQRIVSIIGDLPTIGKDSRNQQQGYNFRGIDTIMEELKPLLAKHGVLIAPQVVERLTNERSTKAGGVMYEVNLHVEFRFFGANGGEPMITSAWGEGTDTGDKSTNKAMTAALKNVLVPLFAIAGGSEEADQTTPEPTTGRDYEEIPPEAFMDAGTKDALIAYLGQQDDATRRHFGKAFGKRAGWTTAQLQRMIDWTERECAVPFSLDDSVEAEIINESQGQT